MSKTKKKRYSAEFKARVPWRPSRAKARSMSWPHGSVFTRTWSAVEAAGRGADGERV